MLTKTQQLVKSNRLRGPVERNFGKPNPSSTFGKAKPSSTFGKKRPLLQETEIEKTERLRPAPLKKKKKPREISLDKRDKLKTAPLFKSTKIKEQPLKDKDYLAWFHLQGFACLVCGSTNIEAHHVLRGSEGRPDDSVVPLCPEHHRGKFSPHGFESGKFAEKYPKEGLLIIAKRTYEVFRAEG